MSQQAKTPNPPVPTQAPPKEAKKEKPKDDWKAAAEAKKLKKEQDRLKEKEKLEQKAQQGQKEKEKPKPTPQQKANRAPEPPVKPSQPSEKKPAEPIKVPQAASPLKADARQRQPVTVIESLLPRRLQTLKNIKPDEDALRNVLIEHTSTYFHGNDSVLVASQHTICRQWFERDICELVDIWGISQTAFRKENIIRTRYQDVSHLLHTITKIVCGATAIFQNGVVMSQPGTLMLALLAHEYQIPFIVFCETHRYCDASLLQGDLSSHEGTLYDLINPKYISMLITEAGPITVCSVPTLVSALYGL